MKWKTNNGCWLLILVIMATCLNLEATLCSAEWVKVDPIGCRSALNAIDYFPGTTTAVAAADSGFVYRTTDLGLTWNRVNIASVDWNDIACLGSNLGVIVGDQGNIKISHDGGQIWNDIPSFSSFNIDAIAIYDSLHFTVGDDAHIWTTEDGGSTWASAFIPQYSNVYSICYGSQDTVFALAYRQIWRSIDRGLVWASLRQFNYDLNKLKFINSEIGFICGRSCLYRTIDGGATWDSTYSGSNGIGLVIDGINNLKVLSKDGYWKWTNGSFYDWSSESVGGSFSDLINFNSILIAVGGQFGNHGTGRGEIIARSTDLGNSWIYISYRQSLPLNAIYFVSSHDGWLAGGTWFQYTAAYPQLILHTSDGGQNWEKQMAKSGGDGIRDLNFVDSNTGYAVGSGCWKTTDSGLHWYNLSRSGNTVDFINQSVGWIAGFGAIAHSTNGGNNWSTQYPPDGMYDYLFSVHFIDSQTGWCTGYNWPYPFSSIIIKTTDGGSSWSYQYGPNDDDLTSRSIDMLNGQIGVAVCGDFYGNSPGKILKSMDGGNNWIEKLPPYPMSLNAVMYLNDDEIWAASAGGDIIFSIDGGESWNLDTVLVGEEIYDLFAIDSSVFVSTVSGSFYYNSDAMSSLDEPDNTLPQKVLLQAAYPNPFNAATTISYELPRAADVRLEVYDLLGRKVETLAEGRQEAGHHQVQWSAGGRPSGVYFAVLHAGGVTESKSMVLLK